MAVALADKREKRFSDFADEPKPLDGEKIKIDEILNREVEVTGYKIGNSQYSKNKSGKYLTLQVVAEGLGTRIVFSGSDVLIGQVEKYGHEIPFLTVIKKINRYYTLT